MSLISEVTGGNLNISFHSKKSKTEILEEKIFCSDPCFSYSHLYSEYSPGVKKNSMYLQKMEKSVQRGSQKGIDPINKV